MKQQLLFFFFCISLSLQAQTLELPATWKIQRGDNPHFKESAFDDSRWQKITVPSQWETQGLSNYDGYAWYRVHFSIPKKLLKNELYLLLGKVDDIDETYLNGNAIGATGKFPPVNESAWSVQRAYKIPIGALKENNVLAVRVFDGGGPGGIIGGVIGLYTKKEFTDELFLGPAPKKSYTKLTTSNGLIAAVYDEKKHSIESAMPHIFQAYDSLHSVRPFALNIHLVSKTKPLSVGYNQHTHVITASYPDFSISYFAPFTTEEKILYVVARGKKQHIAKLSFSSEEGSAELLRAECLRAEKNYSEKYFLFSFNDSLQNNTATLHAATERLNHATTSLLNDEIQYMKNIFASSAIPDSLSADERNVVEQSIAVLKMAQVGEKEIFPLSRGQILASLPPGVWNIAWVRDGSYAIRALARLGLFKEAKAGLEFMLRAKSNTYKHFVFSDGKDYGIGRDYQISVCRYFGTGSEESDFNEQGPNIEIDGFGLFLSAFADYVSYSNDTAVVQQWNSVLTTKIANVLIECIDSTNLIRTESGPWERHLPGKKFAYTSAVCAEGLYKFAALASVLHSSGEQYKLAADRLMSGIKTHLIVNHAFIKGNFEATEHETDFFDAATFEIFASGLLHDTTLFQSHVSAYREKLHVNDERRGYVRTVSSDWYENQEWIYLDTRLASALCKFNEPSKAKPMLDFITAQAALNFNLIPELYERNNATYEGAIPMVGFGAGTYILALFDYYE